MAAIAVLDPQTIDKISAGEVVERPASVVKELVENSIDAGASAVTVEIREGGKKLIRITDNGSGLEKDQIHLAFLPHATSKIKSIEDLDRIASLGFRGEALSSIAAVSQVELITRTAESLSGARYLIEGGKEISLEEMGAPEGSTFLVRNLFYNTPARKKFLKSDLVEGNSVSELMEQMALSHPEVSFKYVINRQVRLHTPGNGSLKDVIYQIYGKEILRSLFPVSFENDLLKVEGFGGRPEIARGNRGFENYCVNGRFVKNSLITRALEDAYQGYLMQHRFPFVILQIRMDGADLDVNVHPSKREVRFAKEQEVYESVREALRNALTGREMIPEVTLGEPEKPEKREAPGRGSVPEPFEKKRLETKEPDTVGEIPEDVLSPEEEKLFEGKLPEEKEEEKETQMELFEDRLLDENTRSRHRLIGQIFDTYWLVQLDDSLYIIDQHAAHEKVWYERLMKQVREESVSSQYVSPPLIVTLNIQEEALLNANKEVFEKLGFEISPFGGREYSISAVPSMLLGWTEVELFKELLDQLGHEEKRDTLEVFASRIASMACKAAVKGNHSLSTMEADQLLDELLTLENPYHCPHGRPVIISMTRTELEKKFKRIV